MTALTLKPEPAAAEAADKPATLPAPAAGLRRGPIRLRRRITATHLVPTESGLHPFRVN